ncbi:MAG TPA: nitroreductase/quinone reductase family protein [Acidimicrobiales bacterium]|jgi:deazaflavin-dependent oxidoreductase (nitroreductase family)|nr:nitroreductase/quinone reductase family protein [Acidimicrobiales bacterium]
MPIAQTVMDGVVKSMNVVHRAVMKASGGRLGQSVLGMEAVELHTTGRRSGQRRSVMLTAPIFEPDRVVLIASKGGDDRNPDWYTNLVAQPEVELTHRGTTRSMRARTASAAEKADLWPQVVDAYKGYAGYQKRTERDIPVVILEPR